MSQPANDDFSQHLSDDEASYHEDASDNVSVNIDELPQMASFNVSSDPLHNVQQRELLNEIILVSNLFRCTCCENPENRQQHNTTHTSTTTDVADPLPLNIHSTHQTPTQVPTVTAPENIIQAETNTENA
ncbi:hypothetical protein Tco_1049886 [Tanacetum coccineum]